MSTSQVKTRLINELQTKLNAIENYQKYKQLDFAFEPKDHEGYKKHLEFFEAGSWARFRMLAGGNGSGKSFTVAYETVCHCTGLYPEWWKGKKLRKPTTVWIVAESMALFRDSMQQILIGKSGNEEGTGLIPKDCLLKTEAYTGVTGAFGRILVRHKLGHVVTIVIKTFDMRRENLQAATIDLLVCDEEPPEDVYMECVMRTRGTKKKEPGIVMLAFTSFAGMTGVVLQYVPNGVFPKDGKPEGKPNYYVQRVSWDDAPHLTEQDKEEMLTAIPVNQRDSRVHGYIALGAGKVYPIHEEDIKVNYLKIGSNWKRAFGWDFGWNCTAGVWGAKDPDTSIIYLYGEYYQEHMTPQMHAIAIKKRGEWIPGISDPRGDKSSEADGTALFKKYADEGIHFTPGNNALQSGILDVLSRFENGTLKVCYNLENWWNEFRTYRYDKDNPNKIARDQKDHLMDATRYLISKFDRVAVSPDEILEEENQLRQVRPQLNIDRNPITGY